MNHYSDNVREIDLKDLLYRTFRRWRSVLIGAVIIALLAALSRVASGVILMLDEEKLAEVNEKYVIAVSDYEATGERLRTNIVNLRAQSENQQEYNNKSELMKIDPMNKWNGHLQLYVDSKYQIDPSLTYQNIDLTNRLVSAYSSYLRSGELYTEIMEQLDTVDEIRFLSEIYNVSADPGTATIAVNCMGVSEAAVRELLDFVKLKIANRYETIRDAIGDHGVEIMTESVYSTIDLDLDAKQKANILAISDYANAIGEKSAELTEWENKAPPEMEYGTWYTAKQAIKALILGGIIGAVVLLGWYAVSYIVTRTVKTVDDWRAFEIPVIASIHRDAEKRRFQGIDALIDRIFGQRRGTGMERDCLLTAHNLDAVLREQGLSEMQLVGIAEPAFAESIARKLEAAAQGTKYAFAGNPLTDPNTANSLAKSDKVVLLAENQTTKIEDINQMLTLLRAWGKSILGVVVLE